MKHFFRSPVRVAAFVLAVALFSTTIVAAESEGWYGTALETLDGEPVQLSDYAGKWTLVVFWASWCSPCRREIPHLKELYDTYGSREDFMLIGLSLDETEGPLKTLVHNTGIRWPVVRLGAIEQQLFSEVFGVKSIPHFALLSPDGKIHANGIKGRKLDRELERLLQPVDETRKPPSSDEG